MERITNDNLKVFEQLKIELSYSEKMANHTLLFCFIEISQLLAFAYSIIALKEGNSFKYLIKIWDNKYDMSRFNLGIYNIDRLAIKEREITVKDMEHNFIQELYIMPLQTIEYKGIVLDGLFCSLHIPSNEIIFDWNINEEMNSDLLNFVIVLRKIANDFGVFG